MSKTHKIDFQSDWIFKHELRKIVDKNCEVIPYEGTEVNREGIVRDIIELLNSKEYSLLKHDKP